MGEIVLTSSVLITSLLVLRKICWGRISRRLQYALWILVLIRLMVPAQFLTSPISMMQVLEEVRLTMQDDRSLQEEELQEQSNNGKDGENFGGNGRENDRKNAGKFRGDKVYASKGADSTVTDDKGTIVAQQTQDAGNLLGVPAVLRGLFTKGVDPTDGIEASLKKACTIIYLLGVMVAGSVLLSCNLLFLHKLRTGRVAIGQEGCLKVWLVKELEVPCLCGVLRPAIYLNEAGILTEERKIHILCHERTHYRHGDHIWTLLRSFCLVVYWFHPLVWAAAVISARDSELACDEGTLERLGEESRQAYGRTLIGMAVESSRNRALLTCATGVISHGKEIRQRISIIATARRGLLRTAVAVVLAALALAACTAGKPEGIPVSEEALKKSEDREKQKGTEEADSGSADRPESFPVNGDGSYRLSEYIVDLTGDKLPERIVFDVYYYADLGAKADVITEELLWEEIWNGCEVIARVLSAEDTGEKILWEHSYSEAHAGNGNLAVVSENGQNYLLLYHNLMYQGSGQLLYQLLQLQEDGGEPVIVAENWANYEGEYGDYGEEAIQKLLEVEKELDEYLMAYDTRILLNASVSCRENCYLHGCGEGLLNGVKRQSAFDIFRIEVGSGEWNLTLKDILYPVGTQSLTQLPENAEERILAGEVLCMEVDPENATAGRLDLDGDGEREVLYLYAVGKNFGDDGWQNGIIDEYYRVRVNKAYCEDYCDIMDPVLMAWSPDGQTILLAVYDDGPSNDPKTIFYRYENDSIYPAGRLMDDLRTVEISTDGVIRGRFRVDMIQTEWAYAYYEWNGREIEKREDDVYYLLDDSGWRSAYGTPLLLLEELKVYAERNENSSASVMKPQEVVNVATDAEEWVLLRAADGTEGWLRLEGARILQLGGKRTSEVFDGLNMAD